MGWLVGWLADWLVGWWVWLFGWLVGGWAGGVHSRGYNIDKVTMFSQDISPRYIVHKQGLPTTSNAGNAQCWYNTKLSEKLIQYKSSSPNKSFEISSGVFASVATVADAAG